ncbi:ESPR-type extended signal peptide-containing protein, partial [Serratia sp. DD3]|uniref:ESPR-type extended signal peptide-containing protein n=1 Tax=Serratia sp. DD3 TaxID=1410619 RepID=UPI00210142D6
MNKVYRVIWNAALQLWVVVSELANTKQKTASHSSRAHQGQQGIAKTNKLFKNSAIALSLFSSLAIYNSAYAITVAECDAAPTTCVKVATASALNTALSASGTGSTATTILLTANIDLTALYSTGITVNQATNARRDLVIDGGGYNLKIGSNGFKMDNGTTNNSAWAGQNATFKLVNFGDITSTSPVVDGTTAHIVYVQDASTRLAVTLDNINTVPDGKMVAMGADGAGLADNNSPVILGNFNQLITLTLGTYRQSILGSNITLNGNYDLNGIPSANYPAVFWSNGTAANSVLHFTSTADVNITGNWLTNGPGVKANTAGSYNFLIDDGAKVSFAITGQNPLGLANYGVEIGSYDIGLGQFGAGAVINMNNQAGDAISNASSTTGSFIYNGQASTRDVIYNLGTGSSLVVANNAGYDGILATKTTGTGGIYIRSAGTISDGTTNVTAGSGINVSAGTSGNVVVLNDVGGVIRKATGITVTDTGTRVVKVTNAGTINSTTAGVALAHNGTGTVNLFNSGVINNSAGAGIALTGSAAGKLVTVDSTGGTINATAGNGITLDNNVVLVLSNGTITTTGSAVGLAIGASNAGTQSLTGTIFNLNGTGAAITKGASATVNLSNTQFNAIAGTVFTSLAGFNFQSGTANNAINLTGSSAATGISSTVSLDFTNAYLDINVNNAAATGISTSGATGGSIIVGPNMHINASGGASAITFNNSIAETLTNNGFISGSVTMGNSGNTITNNGTLGSLTSGTGVDTLTLNNGSVSNGIIDLGAGANIVNIYDGATNNIINTGAGNDTFNIYNLTNASTTSLGNLNAGIGTNTLNFNNSTRSLDNVTQLQNFTNINLTNSSNITLGYVNNIASGNVNVATGNKLLFGSTYNGGFTAVLTGAGDAEVQSGANVILSGANTLTGNWLIDSSGTLNASAFNQLGTAAVGLNGVLNLQSNGTLTNVLTGNGLLNISNTAGVFNFGATVGNAFTGIVDISTGTLNLSSLSPNVLNNATLRDSVGGLITMDAGTNNVGNLVLNGGTLQFAAGNLISTGGGNGSGLITVSGDSIIKVDTTLLTSGNLLDLNAGSATALVQSSNTLSGADLARLQLQDLSGNSLLGGANVNYQQNSQFVSINTYDFDLTSGTGLKVNKQLTQLDLQDTQTLTLTSNGATNTTLTAKVTGSGSLAIGSDNVAMTISNSTNDYTGATTVNAGSLTLGADNSLGGTSLLDVAALGTVNLAGHEQTVTALSNAGVVNLANGTLNITNGGTSSGTGGLTGGGALNVNGGTLTLSAANSSLSADTLIAAPATVNLTAADALGSGDVDVVGTLNLNAADTLANILSGDGTINTNAAVTLEGTNDFSGQHNINAGGVLTITDVNNLGTSAASVDLTVAGAELIIDGVVDTLANTLSGDAASTVQLTNNANTTLTGSNTLFTGLFDLVGNSTLSVSQNANLGDGSVRIANGSTLNFNAFEGGALTSLGNVIEGAGSWVLNNSDIDLRNNSNASGFTGLLDINTASTLTIDSLTALDGSTILNVDGATSTLNITNAGAFTLNNTLTGAGQVNVDTTNGAFNFDAAVGNAFTGNVTLNNATFSLAGDNADTLQNAGLTLATGSVTTVGIPGTPSTATLQDLVLDGGTLNFTGGVPLSSAESIISTVNLTANSGTINVDNGGSWNNDSPSVSLLDQNLGITETLITATTASAVDGLSLKINGQAVTPAGIASAINQNSVHVANGTYNYSLSNTNGSADGLYLNYGLSAIELLTDTGNGGALIIAAGTNRELTALLTGVGGIVFDATQSPLTVTNSNNLYQGSTTVQGGTVQLGSNNGFGETLLLTVASTGTFNGNSFNQTVKALDNQGTVNVGTGILTNSGLLTNTGVIDITGGTLNLNGGGTSTAVGGLTGAGALNINGGTLTLSAANSGLTTATDTLIAALATVNLTAADALGSSDVDVVGTLNLNAADTLANILSGDGTINTNAAVTLEGTNDFSGQHNINAGGVLTITDVNNLGTSDASVDLTAAGAELILDGVSGTLANTLSGDAAS